MDQEKTIEEITNEAAKNAEEIADAAKESNETLEGIKEIEKEALKSLKKIGKSKPGEPIEVPSKKEQLKAMKKKGSIIEEMPDGRYQVTSKDGKVEGYLTFGEDAEKRAKKDS